MHGETALVLEEQLDRYMHLGEKLREFVGDTGAEVRAAYARGKLVLFEGAQGALLDIDHGTYPFVTSSNTGSDGVAAGAGFPARSLDRVIGIAKAYCTRVGEGPFPSEDHGADGVKIREAGNEYGATTGRPRRCGWFDVLAMRFALELNGADGWIMTNLDVLDGFEEIKVATSYQVAGQRYREWPGALVGLNDVTVGHGALPGWRQDTTGIRRYADLPAAARRYVEWVEKLVGVPIVMLSVGPERDQVIPREGAGAPLVAC